MVKIMAGCMVEI